MVAKLTNASEVGKPPVPISLNPDHVVELKPRYRPKPNLGNQSGGLLPGYEGCVALLVTGDRINLLEEYADAHEKLWPGPWSGQNTEREVPKKQIPPPPAEQNIPASNITNLSESIPDAAPQEPASTSEPAKKAPGKKAKPQLIDHQETINKITVVKDEPVKDQASEEEDVD